MKSVIAINILGSKQALDTGRVRGCRCSPLWVVTSHRARVRELRENKMDLMGCWVRGRIGVVIFAGHLSPGRSHIFGPSTITKVHF
jgi:hypothetical protein